MAKIDNFERLMPFIKQVQDMNDMEMRFFILVQVVMRRKDGNNTHSHKSEVLKSYYVSSVDYLKSYESEIKRLCDAMNARAYLNPNIKSYKQVAKMFAAEAVMQVSLYDSYTALQGLYNSCASRGKSYNEPRIFCVDIDDMSEKDAVVNAVKEIGDNTAILCEIPTPHGLHLLTTPFNRREYNKRGFTSLVRPNDNTLLYANLKE